MMIVDIWRTSFSYSAPWRRMLQEARVIDMKLLAVLLQRL